MFLLGVISIVALALFRVCEQSQVSLSRTTPPGMLSVCPNTMTVFTCRTTGSSILVWTSAEYIGHNQLEFTTASTNGSSMAIINGGAAILTQNSNGILESQLRIRASLDTSIRCFPNDVNDGVTMNLTVYKGFPGRPTRVAAAEIPFFEDSCAILVRWDPPIGTQPEDISHYIVRESINGIRENTNTNSTLATFQLNQCTNNISISIATVDRCEREGPRSATAKPNFFAPINSVTDSTTPSGTLSPTTPTTAATNNPGASSFSLATIALSLVVVTIVVFVILLIIIIIILLRWRKERIPRYSKDIEMTRHRQNIGPDYTEMTCPPRNTMERDAGPYLSMKDLAQVHKDVLRASREWYALGIVLGIHSGDLEAIQTENDDSEVRPLLHSQGEDSETMCLGGVLMLFLQNKNPQPSWTRLADALASPDVNRKDIAAVLRNKYCRP